MNEWSYFNWKNMPLYTKELLHLPSGLNTLWLRYFKEMVGTAMSLFEYENLPEGLTTQKVEYNLMFNANMCMARIPGLDNRVVLCNYTANNYDIYQNPKTVNLQAFNGTTLAVNVPFEEIVLVKDNNLDIVPYICLANYIEHLMTIDKTLDINIELLRLPTMFLGSRKQVAELQQIFKKVQNFEPYAVIDPSMKDCIQTNKLDVNNPEDIFKILLDYRELCLSSIGIYSASKKRERLITAEVEATNDYTDMVYDERYNNRKLWVDKANEKFGLNIKLIERYAENKRDEIELTAEEAEAVAEAENVGGEDNGRDV